MKTTREQYDVRRNTSGRFEQKHGFVRVVCLDDEHNDPIEEANGGTRVPRATAEGGIIGLNTPGDKKYGMGVTRRQVDYDDITGEFSVRLKQDNFRPDGLPPSSTSRLIDAPEATEEQDGTLALCEQLLVELTKKVNERLGVDPEIEELELHLPRELYAQYKDGFTWFHAGAGRNCKTAYGTGGRISLRHKRTGLVHKIDLP